MVFGRVNCRVFGGRYILFCGLECFVGIVGSCRFRLVSIRTADIAETALSRRAL